jgi:hypothetical protein
METVMKKMALMAQGCLAVLLLAPAHAAVTADEAARLKTELTPLGAERAGNKDGSIPAWNGGYTTPIPGDKPGGKRGDPFSADKPLYSVTAANMAQHADKLTDGVKALLKKYPNSYRLDVYPTRRTASAPQWVYDNTAKNAVHAKLNGHVVSGAYGGLPFPIPKNGLEAIWNHKLAWRGASWEADFSHYQLTANGKVVLTTEGKSRNQMPYYFKDGAPDAFDGTFWEINLVNSGPPIRAGEMIVGRSNVDEADRSSAYVYLTGQRRVRKLPNNCCDTPTPASAGVMTFDELAVFSGKTDLFDWKLLGKKEILIPYNENRFLQAKETDIITGQHLNPEHVRWELHRVWVVEAKLLPGQRHQAPRSVYYLDEDTWVAHLGDRWDANGQLWKTLWAFNYVMPDFPGAIQQTSGFYDLLSGQGYVSSVMNKQAFHLRPSKRWPENIFTGDGLSAQGVR